MEKTDLPKVVLRGGFSDRMGIKTINTQIQTKELDHRTRVSIVNLLSEVYGFVFGPDYNGRARNMLLSNMLSNVYMQQIDYCKDYVYVYDERRVFEEFINKTILEDEYDAVFTLIEYVVGQMNTYVCEMDEQIDVFDVFNQLFEKEYVGYRFINKIIVPITSEMEVVEINDALVESYNNVNKHLGKALALMSDRDTPDYENSIKESISAVEAMCCNILGKHGTLGEALKKIEKEYSGSIHPALREAFLKLYGYAGDASSGIRHAAKIGGINSTFSEAHYMLVVCSAFINYLKTNLSESNNITMSHME